MSAEDKNTPIHIFWFRRDLRLQDNTGLTNALAEGVPVLPLFIFDEHILSSLERDDARVTLIYERLKEINQELGAKKSSLLVKYGKPDEVFESIDQEYEVKAVFTNKDYEPYALQRDKKIQGILKKKEIDFKSFKDHVIFEPGEVLKPDGGFYTIYTPFKNRWLHRFKEFGLPEAVQAKGNWLSHQSPFPELSELGFKVSKIKLMPYRLDHLGNYEEHRDIPSMDGTSAISPYLRFGLVSIRELVRQTGLNNLKYLQELIWREFFIQILYFAPHVVQSNFKKQYDGIQWRNDKRDFERWCKGETGYPIVDAGMRELNQTGYMHNRVRMITAGFLCKHLLIDWRWGEAYFASKLLDYELASNNGNWQWAAGTGCDAAPYFRVFNPITQLDKFDKDRDYVRRWIPEYQEGNYIKPIVEHKFGRERAIEAYQIGLAKI